MLLQIGEQNVLENVLVGFKANGISMPENEIELRAGYQQYLRAMQPHCSWLRSETTSQIDEAVCDVNAKSDLISIFRNVDSGLDDLRKLKLLSPWAAISARNKR